MLNYSAQSNPIFFILASVMLSRARPSYAFCLWTQSTSASLTQPISECHTSSGANCDHYDKNGEQYPQNCCVLDEYAMLLRNLDSGQLFANYGQRVFQNSKSLERKTRLSSVICDLCTACLTCIQLSKNRRCPIFATDSRTNRDYLYAAS